MIIHGDVWAKCTGDSHIMPLSCARQDCQGGYSGPPCRWPGDPAGTRQAKQIWRALINPGIRRPAAYEAIPDMVRCTVFPSLPFF